MKRESTGQKGILTKIIVPTFILFLAVGTVIITEANPDNNQTTEKLETFSNYKELERFIKAGTSNPSILGVRHHHMDRPMLKGNDIALTANYEGSQKNPVSYQSHSSTNKNNETGSGSNEHSSTNVQVKGVDEADIIKNDGEYLYAISGENVIIAKAYPTEKAHISSKIKLNQTPQHLFVNNDKLIIISKKGHHYWRKNSEKTTIIEIYDISQRNDPTRIKQIKSTGIYFDSRMINNQVYLILTEPINPENVHLPEITINQQDETIQPTEIQHFEPLYPSYKYTTILGLNLEKMDLSKETILMGRAQNLYVSRKNIYITNRARPGSDVRQRVLEEGVSPVLPSGLRSWVESFDDFGLSKSEKWLGVSNVLEGYLKSLDEDERREFLGSIRERTSKVVGEYTSEFDKTTIHKISIMGGEINYVTKGEVPGRVLNQFSMSEHKGYFRIATTTGHVRRSSANDASKNNMYVLDDNLEIVGKVENLAPGEKIYSARFMGDKAYLVTFKKVDPLFVIDLKTPQEPEVLGKLKITGYSDYLHPFGENYLIGIGKSTVAAKEGDFAWYQGVKISLFDVSDLNNPKQVSKFVIGDRGTDSPALRDHKAFLLNRDKNLLALPITLAEIKEEQYTGEVPPNARGEYTWQGLYVFKISQANGLQLKGRITHLDNRESFSKNNYYHDPEYLIKRSHYIENSLYTYSEQKIKINKLKNLSDIKELEL